MTHRERDCRVVSNCRSCSAPVRWVIWPTSGKRMPVDAEPVSDGNIVLTHSMGTNTLRAEKYDAGNPKHEPPRKRYVSHFTTCPEAGAHRRKDA